MQTHNGYVKHLSSRVSKFGEALEGAGHQRRRNSRTNPHICAQTLCGGCAKHNGHEVQHRQSGSLKDVPESELLHPFGFERLTGGFIGKSRTVHNIDVHALAGQVGVLTEETELLQEHDQGQDHGGAQQRPQQGTEGIGEHIEDIGEPASLLAPGSLLGTSIIFAKVRHAGQGLHLVVDPLNTVAEHDLSLTGLLNDREHPGDALNLVRIDLAPVGGSYAQTRCAVRKVGDILGTAKSRQNLLAKFVVFHVVILAR